MKRTGPDAATRDLVYWRDGFRCCICQSDQALQAHHRRPRGSGGTSRLNANSPANLLLLCLDCHASVESNRNDALENGWLLRQSVEDPSACPVVWRGRAVFLLDDGTVEDCTPEWLA